MRNLICAAFLIQIGCVTLMAPPLESPLSNAPAAGCAGIAGLHLTNTRITRAEEVRGGSVSVVIHPGAQVRTITDLPPFCRVAGTIKPTSASNILFEVWLPLANWNGKFAGMGNGGWAGTISYGNSARSTHAPDHTGSLTPRIQPSEGSRQLNADQ